MKPSSQKLTAARLEQVRLPALGIATLSFAVSFGAVRALTYSIHVGVGPFHDVSSGGTHVHHMVWGILLLLGVGYIRVLLDGIGPSRIGSWLAYLTAAAYGVGAALTLDEFALWLNMRDVYWQLQGWESISAVLIFAGLLLAGLWSRSVLRAAARALVKSRARTRAPARAAGLIAWVAGD